MEQRILFKIEPRVRAIYQTEDRKEEKHTNWYDSTELCDNEMTKNKAVLLLGYEYLNSDGSITFDNLL